MFDVGEKSSGAIEVEQQGTSRLDAFSAKAINSISDLSNAKEHVVEDVLQILMFRKNGGLSCHLGGGGPIALISLSVTVAKSPNRELRGARDSTTGLGWNIKSEIMDLS